MSAKADVEIRSPGREQRYAPGGRARVPALKDNLSTTEVAGDRVRFDALMASISTLFIDLEPARIGARIRDALRLVGEYAEADRTYVCLLSEDGTTVEETHEWCAEGTSEFGGRLKGAPMSAPWLMASMRRLEPVYIPRVAELGDDAANERAFLESENICSAVMAPMAWKKRLRGFVGLDSVGRERHWAEETISLVTIVGEVVITALERARSEQALVHSEQRYRLLFESHPLPLLVYDFETREFLAVNEAALAQYGYSREEFLRLKLEDIRPPDQIDMMFDHLSDTDPDAPDRHIATHRKRRGDAIEVEVNAYPFALDGRRARLALIDNVSERARVLQALRDSEARYRMLVEVSPDLVGVQSEGRYVFINGAGARMLGASSPAEIIGRDVLDFVHPAYRDEVADRMRRAREEGLVVPLVEEKFVRLDGRVIDVEVSANPFTYEWKKASLVVARETTERRSAEREIKKTVSLLQSTLESTTDGILVVDLAGRIVSFNQRFISLWNLPKDIVETRRDADALQVASERLVDGDDFRRKVRELYEQPEAESFDVLEFVDGRTIERYSAPQYLDGVAVGRVWSFRDITERRRAEKTIKDSEARYRLLFERNMAGVYRNTLDGRILDCNESLARMFGFDSREELMSYQAYELYFDEEDRRNLLRRLRERGSLRGEEICLRRKDGRPVWVLETVSLIPGEGGEEIMEGTLLDISDRKRAEAALTESEERYRLLAQYSTDLISRHTLDGMCLYASPACRTLLGLESEEMVGHPIMDFVHPDDVESVRDAQAELLSKPTYTTRYRIRRKDGAWIWFETTSRPIRSSETGSVVEIIAVSRDISERKEAEQRIEYQAYHDALTGLPNRMLFKDRLSVGIARANRKGVGLAVMFLDLDHFKIVNDTLGHTVGDRLLQGVSERLKESLREEDSVSRLGGDEFTLMVVDLGVEDDAVRIAQKVLDAIALPFRVDEHELFVTTSIGIALYPQDGTDPDTLLKNADSAMYRAKELGRSNYQLCTPAMNARAAERLSMEHGLHLALERNELELHYQPQVALDANRVVGMEALIRWRHPSRGLIGPAEFIPIAEDARLIFPIGDWVLREACARVKTFHDAGLGDLNVAVNLSARQFQQRELIRIVEKALADTGIDPRFVELEITESIAMQNTEWTISMLHDLRAMGISISMDDFGTGHSSLNYLKRFPIDIVKIDRSFIVDVAEGQRDAAIVEAMITMAHGLGMKVFAEGVETEAQRSFLSTRGCDVFQGYLFSHPLPDAELEQLLRHEMA